MNTRAIVLIATLVLPVTRLLAQQGQPPQVPLRIDVYRVSRADVSPPLRDVGPPIRPPVRQHRPLFRLVVAGPQTPSRDTVTQVSTPLPITPSTAGSFDGVAADTYSPAVAPPDENLAVGPNHVVQTVNVQIGVFNKTGLQLSGFPKPINSLWTGFGGSCETHNDGDPIVRYDRQADRWIVTQLTFDLNAQNYHQCVAVSQTGDPTGSYYRYDVDFGPRLQDYPKFSVWPDGWYMSANSFLYAFLLEGSNMCAWERSKLLVGDTTAKVICAVTGSSAFAGLLPSDWDGTTAPPTNAPNHFIGLYSTSSMVAFRMKPNYASPSQTTFTGPIYIPVAGFNLPCGNGGDCVPQRDTSQLLSTVGERLMYRLAYRNFGGHESFVVNHSVQTGSTVGIRWYEIRVAGAGYTIHQQATYAPDADHRWMGSMAMDKSGNIALGYSKSSAAMYPGIFITGRQVSDPLGTLGTEQMVWAGSGSQQDLNRWGDYSSIETDPVDDCTFWYTSQYLPSNGSFNWRTRITKFKFANCGEVRDVAVTSITAPSPVLVANAQTVAVVVSNQGNQSETFSVSLTDSLAASISPPQTMTLAAGASTNVSFSWTPSISGDHVLTASAATVPGEIDTADNSRSTTSTARDPVHDVAVTSVSAPASVTQGTSATVSVTVANQGDFSESFAVSVADTPASGGTAGTLGPAQTVTLSAGGSTTLNFAWNTSGASAGTHTLTATAGIVTGETDTADNSRSTTSQVNAPAGIQVTSITPNSILPGATVSGVSIQGSGFANGATVRFEGGEGPQPAASNVVVNDSSHITLTISVKSGGPPRQRLWDVRVTNPNGSTAVLTDGLRVTP